MSGVSCRQKAKTSRSSPADILLVVGFSHQRHDLVTVTPDPAAYGHPLVTLHLIQFQVAPTLVILRRDSERGTEPLRVKVLDRLVPSSHVVTGDRQAVVLDRESDAFCKHGPLQDAAVVVNAANVLWYFVALIPEHLDEFLDDWMVAPDRRELQAEIALGDVPARRLDVGAAGAPHEADDTVQRKAGPLELLDGHGRRLPKQTPDDPVSLEVAGDVGHLRFHLQAGRLNREQAQHV